MQVGTVLMGDSSLASVRPDVAAQWHPSRNGAQQPADVHWGTNKSFWWQDALGHEWQASVARRTKQNSQCPYCSGYRILAGFNDLATKNPGLAAEWHPTLNAPLLASQVGPAAPTKVWWQGRCGHAWETTVGNRAKGRGCPYCSNRMLLPGFNDLGTLDPAKAAQWHPTLNGALTPADVFPSSPQPVWWQCAQGHAWQTNVGAKFGCPQCSGRVATVGRTDLATLYPAMAAEWHPTKNGDLTPTTTTAKSNRVVWWQDAKGHAWQTSVNNRVRLNRGCPYCAGQRVLSGVNDLATTHPVLAAEWHPTRNGELTPSQITGSSSTKVVWWLSPCGHEWDSTPSVRTGQGQGCPICANRRILLGHNDLATTHPQLAAEWHPTRNGALRAEQVVRGSSVRVWWQCAQGHEWDCEVSERTKAHATSCPACWHTTYVSKGEKDIQTYLEGLGAKVAASNRTVLQGKEIDLYLPQQRIGVEFNGLYWHSEAQGKGRQYHHAKWEAAKAAGVQLIQIWEDDWRMRPETVKRALAHKLGLGQQRTVYARQTAAVEVPVRVAQAFFGAQHIQGFASASHYLALQDRAGTHVAMVALKREAGTAGKTLNIIRYATAANVPGGFTKLLRAAERMYAPARFLTFSDHTISDGGLYANNGFVADKELAPDYMYVVGGQRRHKFGYRLRKFREDPALQWQAGLSERELAELNGLTRVWDAGKTRWVREVAKHG